MTSSIDADWPYLSAISLRNFRNFSKLDLKAGPEPVVLFGNNGSGKTNLLEAISLLAPGRGLRRASLKEVQQTVPLSLDQAETRPWSAAFDIHHRDGPVSVNLHSDPQTGRRRVSFLDKPHIKSSELGRLIAITWLTPSMDRLFAEAPQNRRRFFDRLVLNLHPEHARRSILYQKSLKERMTLLKQDHKDTDWLDAIEERMVELGTAIAAARVEFCELINSWLEQPEFDQPPLCLKIAGAFEERLLEYSALDIEEWATQYWKKTRKRDQLLSVCQFGPHKSDFMVYNKKTLEPVSRMSSGQQKSCLLAIVFADSKVRKRYYGDQPLILLDEVTGHLDPSKRNALCHAIVELGGQFWMTGTDRAAFEGLNGHAQFFAIREGQLTR